MTVTAHRFRATWRSITFNAHYDDTGQVDDPAHVDLTMGDRITLERLEAVQVTVADYRELRQYLEGADPNEAIEGVRMLRARGRVYGSDWGHLEDSCASLEVAFSPASCRLAFAANSPRGLGAFDFKLASASGPLARRFFARPATGRPIILGGTGGGLVVPFLAELVAFDPFAYAQSTATTACYGGNTTVPNPGSVYARPLLQVVFSGAGNAALTITNSTTGQALVINATTAANGETWDIDVATGLIFRHSDGASRYSQRVSGFVSNLYLLPGNNTINLANTGGVTRMDAVVRAAYA